MGCIVFLPGILGSELFLEGEKVWPPTPLETQFGYDRIDKLIDSRAQHGEPIGNVACFRVYKPLIDDLKDIASGNAGAPKRSFHSFGYDWRVDIRDIASNIAARLDALPRESTSGIHIVAHSMGCLVSRVVLESGFYEDRSWFKAIRSLTAIAGPHLGAPVALKRALGLEGVLGLTPTDIKAVGADHRYPAFYQLLPAPGMASLWDARRDAMLLADLYDEEVAKGLGLDLVNLKKALELHGILAKGNRPAHVQYCYLAGSGAETALRVEISGKRPTVRTGKAAGDGTVPLWSAIDPRIVNHIAPGPHNSIFRTEQIRQIVYRSLGARLPALPFQKGGKPLLSIFSADTVYAPSAHVELLVIPKQPFVSLRGELVVEFSEAVNGDEFIPFANYPVTYDGVEVEQLSVRLAPLRKAGFYRVSFVGSHSIASEGAAIFGVSEVGGGVNGL